MGPGALAQRYLELGGAAHFIGKPHKPIFRHAIDLFDGLMPSRIVVIGDFTDTDAARLAATMKMPRLATVDGYTEHLRASGFTDLRATDLSAAWKTILQARLQMYRSLRDTTVAQFGEARYAEYDSAYTFFVGLFVEGKLGGVRMVARRAS